MPLVDESARIILTTEPISAIEFVDALRRETAGAVATFEGTVRAESGAGQLVALEYSAYEQMAREQLTLLRAQALREFDILDAAVAHRLGRLGLGEVSVAIVVVAAHRAPAFDACRWLIDRIKVDVPIWKRDVWANGSAPWHKNESGV